ncbi:MAG: hypothetical protein E7294_05055 [Lachnospiraceae bacterium]|nr:hypothetical protein [Lachnospiraceae bacterium]
MNKKKLRINKISKVTNVTPSQNPEKKGNRSNTALIIAALKEISDQEHPKTVNEITDKVNDLFSYLDLEDKGSIIDNSTVRRCLRSLYENFYDPKSYSADIIRENTLRLGYYVGIDNTSVTKFYYMSIAEKYLPLLIEIVNKSNLSPEERSMLIFALSSMHPYLTRP